MCMHTHGFGILFYFYITFCWKTTGEAMQSASNTWATENRNVNLIKTLTRDLDIVRSSRESQEYSVLRQASVPI